MRSCETQHLTLTHHLASSLDSHIQQDLVMLYFSKAFDKVPHQRLLKKLAHYGIQDTTYKWIKAFLSNRKQHALVDGATSDRANVVSGVPPRNSAGPTIIFNIHK
jgi:hypothetical protein